MVHAAAQIVVDAPAEAGTEPNAGEMVDLAFALRGAAIAPDYADDLWRELSRCLPWLAEDDAVAVHPLAGVSVGQGTLYLSSRSRLILRLSMARAEATRTLIGQCLDLGGKAEVGQATMRRLVPAPVLYSSFVVYGPAEESEFLVAAGKELEGLGFGSPRLICGKARHAAAAAGEHHGFSLMVHGLKIEDSLRLQRTGLGGQRKRGCGIFVQHKSVVAVGE